jgi:hypothetical protein
VQVARYDNRADPRAFSDGQWAWGTAFSHVGVQASLPAELGLVAQWMRGETYWITRARPDGSLSPSSELVEDLFSSRFLMLTRRVGAAHRLSLRYDTFAMFREDTEPRFHSDQGHAWTLGYRYERTKQLSGGIEWLEIVSRRDVWSFYSPVTEATERQLRLQVTYRVRPPAR